jgi:hypothetical protein
MVFGPYVKAEGQKPKLVTAIAKYKLPEAL